MIGITKKRLYKIKKTKNQSRKIPKRKHKRKRKKKQNKSFRRRRKYNLKNKSLKKYKGGGFFTFDEILKLKKHALPEIAEIHKAKLARLKEAAKQGEKVIIKQIIPADGKQDEYGIMDMYFGEDMKLKDDYYSTKTPENLRQKNLKNKLLGLELSIQRKNMAPFKKPLYEIINSILFKMALDKKDRGPLYKYLKMPFYKNDGPNNVDERKITDPFHDIADENNGSIELMKLLTANEWFKVMFTDPERNYSVESMATASAVPGVIESGLTVLQHQVQPPPPPGSPPAMVVPPGVAVSSKRPTPVPPPQLQAEDIPSKDDSDDETDSVDSEKTETDDETIMEDLQFSLPEMTKFEAELTKEEIAHDIFDRNMANFDYNNESFFNKWWDEMSAEEDDDATSLTKEEASVHYREIDEDDLDNIYQTVQSGTDEEFVTSNKNNTMQKAIGFEMMSDKEEEQIVKEIENQLEDAIKISDDALNKIPKNSTQPLEEPVQGIEERMDRSRRERSESADSIERKTSFNGEPADEGLIRGPTPRPKESKLSSLGKKIKGKIKDYADAAKDPDTGFAARVGKLAPKKYVKLPPADKPNIYFKATFQNDDWNLKLEKEGFAKDARSWLSKVGIMSGGNIAEIKSY